MSEYPDWLFQLADALTRQPRDDGLGVIQAGYTYFGQFIAHDIVPPTNATNPTRKVSTSLNLDSIYGSNAGHQALMDEKGNFIMNSNGFDLKRDQNGVAQLIEPRNDDNRIIAQLQVFWQRFHNALNSTNLTRNGKSIQEWVTLLFQLITVEDFLKQLLDPRVFDSCFVNSKKFMGFKPSIIPPEFTHAGFRFGHSMVRSDYQLNGSDHEIPLHELLKPNQAIPKEHQISWSKFFSASPTSGKPAQSSNKINTLISSPMTRIPSVQMNNPAIHIAVANLQAGENAGLMRGNKYALEIKQGVPHRNQGGRHEPPLTLGLVPLGNDRTSALGLETNKIPLWPYLLLEAEIHNLGLNLGVLGSLIVAETIWESINASNYSIFQNGKYSFDSAIDQLGELGEALRETAKPDIELDSFRRQICMHHVIKLLTNLEKNSER